MTSLIARLFGRLSIENHSQSIEGFESRRAQELLCYLLFYHNRPHSREALASILWGETSTSQSRANLRKTLCQLQSALASLGDEQSDRTLLVEAEWIQINPQVSLWCDVSMFEAAFKIAEGTAGELLSDSCAQQIEQAVALYRGDLLEGWYQDWCLYERERLQMMYLALLDKLMAFCEHHHWYERALSHGAQVLRYDRAHEPTHRRMMRLHFLTGDRTTALRQYERCVAVLYEELSVSPSELTSALYEQIKQGRVEEVLSGELLPKAESHAGLLQTILNRLNHVKETIAAMQGQVQHDIETVERLLRTRQ